MSAPGTSRLTDEQTQWFKQKYGERYLAVQENADIASRQQRRAWKRKQRRRPDGKTYGHEG